MLGHESSTFKLQGAINISSEDFDDIESSNKSADRNQIDVSKASFITASSITTHDDYLFFLI